MSIQSLDSPGRLSAAKRPAVKDAPAKPAMPRETLGGGIAGGSSTFERLQKGNQKRPLWMMAAPAAIVVAAAGALVYAATMSHPGANPARTAPVPAASTDTPAAPTIPPAAAVAPQPAAAPAATAHVEHRDVAVARRTERPEARMTHRAVVQPQAQPSPTYPTTAAPVPSTPSAPVNPPDTTPPPTLTTPPTPAPTATPPVTTTPPN